MTPRRTPLAFFALAFLLSVPFWFAGAAVGIELLPGLPASAFMVICPALAGGLLTLRAEGRAAMKAFFREAVDFGRMRPWAWPVALATMPLALTLSGAFLLATGKTLPALDIDASRTLALFAVFLLAATAEELGWTGYATRPLLESRGIVMAGLVIGAVSVLWHLAPLVTVGRSWSWIAWWALGTVSRRVIIVWLYARGGRSVFSASLFHAMSNLSWMLFPHMGSHYDPASAAIITTAIAAVVVAPAQMRRG